MNVLCVVNLTPSQILWRRLLQLFSRGSTSVGQINRKVR